MCKCCHYLNGCLIAVSCILVMGCKENHSQTSNKTTVISIQDYENSTLQYTDFISRVDTIELNTGAYFMGSVKDLCIADSVAYILDTSNSIWAFKIPTGQLIKRIQKVGHGYGEYISLEAITAMDSLLYAYDFPTKRVLEYDNHLNFKKTLFSINFITTDFIKAKNGFLFLNMLTHDDLHRIVYTDDEGKLKGSYFPSNMQMNHWSGGEVFVRDEKGRIFITEPYSNEIYQWTTSGPDLTYQTDFGKKNRKEDVASSIEITESTRAFNTHVFILDNYVINYFSKDREAYYSVYNTANGLHQQGETDTTSIIPFFPRWQCAEGLVGILNTSDYNKWKPKKDSCDAALFIFHLK